MQNRKSMICENHKENSVPSLGLLYETAACTVCLYLITSGSGHAYVFDKILTFLSEFIQHACNQGLKQLCCDIACVILENVSAIYYQLMTRKIT